MIGGGATPATASKSATPGGNMLGTVLFDQKSSSLTDSSQQVIAQAADIVKSRSLTRIQGLATPML